MNIRAFSNEILNQDFTLSYIDAVPRLFHPLRPSPIDNSYVKEVVPFQSAPFYDVLRYVVCNCALWEQIKEPLH
jgi:hypothetical protein